MSESLIFKENINVTNITYGRDVGYKEEQESFDDATHAISATEIRKMMGV